MPIRCGALRNSGTTSLSHTSTKGSVRVRHDCRGFLRGQAGIALNAARRANADTGLGGSDSLGVVFALGHVVTNPLVADTGSRNEPDLW
jgi:hypothetical protein